MWPRVENRRLFTALMVVLAVLAWLTLWVWGQSPYGRFLSHERLGDAGIGGDIPILMLVFVAGWTLMTVAILGIGPCMRPSSGVCGCAPTRG